MANELMPEESKYFEELKALRARVRELEDLKRENKRAGDLLEVMNTATLAMDNALTPEQVFLVLVKELKKLGFECIVFLVDESSKYLHPKYISYDSKLLAVVEKLVNIKSSNFSITISDIDLYKRVIYHRETIFIENVEDVTMEVLPALAKKFAGQILSLLNIPGFILAPLIVEDKVIGAFSMQSKNLTKKDIPAVTAFAHRLAANWRKTRLMAELELKLEELKKTQNQLLQAQKMKAIGILAGGVAHDFNNLLTVISGYSEVMLGNIGNKEVQIRNINQIRKAAARGSSLTGQLLAFSRRQVLQPRLLNINSIVLNVIKMLSRLLGEDINIITDLNSSIPSVKADPCQVEQILMNLSINSRDAMPDGGNIFIKTEMVHIAENDIFHITGSRPGKFIRLTVSDTGEGMNKEALSHIFEPFYTTKPVGKGTGLGLSVVYGIVKEHSGWINVYSEPEKGTSFKIYFPAFEKELEHKEISHNVSSYIKGAGERILLIEDDSHIRQLTCEMMTDWGYKVFSAPDGRTAKEIFKTEKGNFDLVFCDIVLPDKNGIHLIAEFISKRPRLEVLLTSGYAPERYQYPLIDKMGFSFLQKPYTSSELLKIIRKKLVH